MTLVKPIRDDGKSHSFDQLCVAAMADRVFLKSRNIAAIDVGEPGFFADLPGPQ